MNHKYEIWPGRYSVILIAHEYAGYKDVEIQLFQKSISEEEASRLLQPFGITEKDEEYYRDAVSQIEETFSIEQVEQLINHFSKRQGTKIEIVPAYIPMPKHFGIGLYPEGFSSELITFNKADNYPLDFEVWGYYELKDCEQLARGKVDSAKKMVSNILRNDHEAWLIFIREISDPHQNWVTEPLMSST